MRKSNSSPSRFQRLLRAAFGAVLLLSGCDEATRLPSVNEGDPDKGECRDKDGDGLGEGCSAGRDCDDTDAEKTNECYVCKTPHTGCACSDDDQGLRAPCGRVESEIDGQVTCGTGQMVCDNGRWGECIINNAVELLPENDARLTLARESPETCPNPCDPYCNQWPKDNTGISPDAGVITTSDGGVTIPEGDGGITVVGTCSGGTIGTCSHHLCETGTKLNKGCDDPAGAVQCIAKGAACPGAKPCCYGLTCQAGTCQAPPSGSTTVFWEDTFAGGNSKGWTLGTEWAISSATTSSGQQLGYADPAADTTTTADNKIAGVVIGGNAATSTHGYRYLQSPSIDTSAAYGTMTLNFKRWLNSDFAPYMTNTIDVRSDGSWTNLWTSGGSPAITSNSWASISFDITAYKDSSMAIRFGFKVGDSSVDKVSSWNIDDVQIVAQTPPAACVAEGASCGANPCCNSPNCTAGKCTTPPTGCAAEICASDPTCCTTAWTAACVAKIGSVCADQCNMDQDGKCVLCFKDALDHDGDGYSFAEGDCRDCDPLVNPGAFDFPGNGVDEDCTGVVDDEPKNCDTGLPFSTSTASNYGKAIDLCRTTTAGATGAAKTWGVISSSLVRANGTSSCSDALQRGITDRFGTNNVPQGGSTMAMFSSGTARDKNDSGYVSPNGQNSGSYQIGNQDTPPAGFPKNAIGCPNGTAAYDSCGMKISIRAPTNAKSFAYSFNFFTSEYAEWVCTSYNDAFVALYTGSLNPIADKNISFDNLNNPVSVNIGLFSVPGLPTAVSHPVLDGTGFDGSCNNNISGATFKLTGICGGATNWLQTTAPVKGGEIIDLHFSIWDTGDKKWDSTVLVDHFTWSTETATIQTIPDPPVIPKEYKPGDFIRTYDAQSACTAEDKVVWGLWSWSAATPSDTNIEYYLKAASTEAGLASAVEYPLQFSNPPGPSALAGQAAKARALPTDTQSGSSVVDTTLDKVGLARNLRFVRIRSRLNPSTNKLSAPTLKSWNLEVSCRPNQ